MLLNWDDHLSVLGDSPILMFPVKKVLNFEVNLTSHLVSTLPLTLYSLPVCSA